MIFEVLSFQMMYNLWWLLKYLIGKKDNEKKSAKRPTGGTVTVKIYLTIMLYACLSFNKTIKFHALHVVPVFSSGIENGIVYLYFSRYCIEDRNSDELKHLSKNSTWSKNWKTCKGKLTWHAYFSEYVFITCFLMLTLLIRFSVGGVMFSNTINLLAPLTVSFLSELLL